MKPATNYDLAQAVTESVGGYLYDVKGKEVGTYLYLTDPDLLDEFFKTWIATHEAANSFFLTLDLETQGLDPYTCNIILVCISWDGRNSIVFDPRYCKPKLFKTLLEQVPLANTSIKFDLKFLAHHYGVMPTPIFDTEIGCKVGWTDIWPGKREFKLSIQVQHLLPGVLMEKETRNSFIGMPDDQICTRRQIEYGAIDAILTHNLILPVALRLHNQGLLDVWRHIELPLIPVLARSELTGLPVDIPWLQERYTTEGATLKTQLVELATQLRALVSEEVFAALTKKGGLKPMSSAQVPKVLRAIGLPAECSTKDHLEELRAQHPNDFLSKLITYREKAGLVSKYCKKYLEEHIHPLTGRVHASFSSMGALTGRLSAKEPPVHGVTEEYRPMIRAPEGWGIGQVDESQYELRAMAGLSKEPTLLDAYKERERLLPSMKVLAKSKGEPDPDQFCKLYAKGAVELTDGEEALTKQFLATDAHRQTAAKLQGKPVAEVTDAERSVNKTLNYAILYGAEPPRLQVSLANEGFTFSLAECSELQNHYFDTLPCVSSTIEQIHAFVAKHGYVESCGGRRRHFNIPPKWRSDYKKELAHAQRQAVNFHCQSVNANAIKRAMIEFQEVIDQRWPDLVHILLNVHDEIVFMARLDVLDVALETLAEIMVKTGSEAIGYTCPVEVSVARAAHWRK